MRFPTPAQTHTAAGKTNREPPTPMPAIEIEPVNEIPAANACEDIDAALDAAGL